MLEYCTVELLLNKRQREIKQTYLFNAAKNMPPLVSWLRTRLQEKAADTIESLHKAGIKVWVLTGDKMETAAATCYASKLFHRNTQILELTTKRTEEQSLHDVLFELSRMVLRQHGGMTRDTFSEWVLCSQHASDSVILQLLVFDRFCVFFPGYQVIAPTMV